MPLIQISMARGRTTQQKRALLESVAQAVHESIGTPVGSIRVWIQEFDPEDFIAGGEILADRRKRQERDTSK